MSSIKVSFYGTLRQVSLPSTPSWLDFETKIRDAHNIPPSEPITVTYIDADNDVITLDTDQELADALEIDKIRFDVTTFSGSFYPPLPDQQSQTNESETAKQSNETTDKDVPPPLPPYEYQDPPETVPIDSEARNNTSETNDRTTEEIFNSFATGLYSLIDGLVKEVQRHPEVIERAGELGARIAVQTREQLEPVFRQMKEEHGNRGMGWGWGRGGRGGHHGPRGHYHHHGPHHHWRGGPSHRGSWRGPGGPPQGAPFMGPWGFWNQAPPSGPSNRAAPPAWNPWSFWGQPANTEATTEEQKIAQLRDMGFWDFEDAVLKKSLEEKNGDVDATVELLFAERERISREQERGKEKA
ncbi:hypothetical protein HK098_001617 [Nowakowskiella sp. JEL0407]|nr:hypothetical protein HK098_001617 [Nowakowskiella sp. JEL0407]